MADGVPLTLDAPFDSPATVEREKRRIDALVAGALIGGVDRAFDRRANDNDWAGVRTPTDASPHGDERDGEGIAWPPPEADEASISVLDLEAQAAVTPLGPTAAHPTAALDAARAQRPVSKSAPGAQPQVAPVLATTAIAPEAPTRVEQVGHSSDGAAAMFSNDTSPSRSPLASVLVAAAVVAAIGIGSYAFVRSTAERATPTSLVLSPQVPRGATVGDGQGQARGAESAGGAGADSWVTTGSAGQPVGGRLALQEARDALARGELDVALASVLGERRERPVSADAQQLLTRILRSARDRVVAARREAGMADPVRRSAEFAGAVAAESDGVKAWREGRYEAALRLFNDAAATYGRLAGRR